MNDRSSNPTSKTYEVENPTLLLRLQTFKLSCESTDPLMKNVNFSERNQPLNPWLYLKRDRLKVRLVHYIQQMISLFSISVFQYSELKRLIEILVRNLDIPCKKLTKSCWWKSNLWLLLYNKNWCSNKFILSLTIYTFDDRDIFYLFFYLCPSNNKFILSLTTHTFDNRDFFSSSVSHLPIPLLTPSTVTTPVLGSLWTSTVVFVPF